MSTSFMTHHLPPRIGEKNKSSSSALHIIEENVNQDHQPIVLSWEHFLCPSAYMDSISQCDTKDEHLRDLDTRLVETLLHASTIGYVYILCENGAKYIEEQCDRYFPQCTKLFTSSSIQQKMNVLCATNSDSLAWYTDVLFKIANHHFSEENPVSLTAFGSDLLRDGCVAIYGQCTVDQISKVKVIRTSLTTPTINDTLKRLDVLHDNLILIVRQTECIDSILSV